MTLKNRIAKILRRWAEKLDPLFPYNINYAPNLKSVTYDIQKVMCKHTIPRYLYEQNPCRISQLAREDIITDIAKDLDARNLINIMIEPTSEKMNFIGEVTIIDFNSPPLYIKKYHNNP